MGGVIPPKIGGKMKEFSGLMRVEIEIIIEAKSKDEAKDLFEHLNPIIFIENDSLNPKVTIFDERNNLDCIEWEVSELDN